MYERKKFTRRNFLSSTIGFSSLFLTFIASIAAILKFLFPKVLYEPSSTVLIEDVQNFNKNSVTQLSEKKLFLIKDDKGIRALSATCTHLGCTVDYIKSESIYRCPCHGSKFNQSGVVLSGPAPKALEWFFVKQKSDGTLVVDKSRRIASDEYLKL